MALNFSLSADIHHNVVVTCDPAVICDDEQRSKYLETGDISHLKADGATIFTIHALSPSQRENAEIKAGAYTRSELGRMLWTESPDEIKERARWHHNLNDDEWSALAEYQAYISRCYVEMISEALISIDGEDATIDQIQKIKPESHRLQTITELVQHIQRLSLVSDQGKQHLPLLFGSQTIGADLGAVSNANQNQILEDNEATVAAQSSQLFNMCKKMTKVIMCLDIDLLQTVEKVSATLRLGLAQSQTQTDSQQSSKLIKDLKETYARSQIITLTHHAL